MKKELENMVIIDFKSQEEWDKCCELLPEYHSKKKGVEVWKRGSAALYTRHGIWSSKDQADYYHEFPRITAAEFIASHEEKEPLPALGDIEWIKISPSDDVLYLFDPDLVGVELTNINGMLLLAARSAYDKGINVTWKLKEKDPHAEIRAEYEQALKDGKYVKLFIVNSCNNATEVVNPTWASDKYKLVYYKIDWSKVPQGTPVEILKGTHWSKAEFIAIWKGLYLVEDKNNLIDRFIYCKLSKDVNPENNWLVETIDS